MHTQAHTYTRTRAVKSASAHWAIFTQLQYGNVSGELHECHRGRALL